MDDWVDIGATGKNVKTVMTILVEEFHKIHDADEINYKLLIDMSRAIGYQVVVFSQLVKDHEFAKRLEKIEHQVRNPQTLTNFSSSAIVEEANKIDMLREEHTMKLEQIRIDEAIQEAKDKIALV